MIFLRTKGYLSSVRTVFTYPSSIMDAFTALLAVSAAQAIGAGTSAPTAYYFPYGAKDGASIELPEAHIIIVHVMRRGGYNQDWYEIAGRNSIHIIEYGDLLEPNTMMINAQTDYRYTFSSNARACTLAILSPYENMKPASKILIF